MAAWMRLPQACSTRRSPAQKEHKDDCVVIKLPSMPFSGGARVFCGGKREVGGYPFTRVVFMLVENRLAGRGPCPPFVGGESLVMKYLIIVLERPWFVARHLARC